MSEPNDLNGLPETPDATAFERRLRAVRPVTPRIDRDRLMFLAGQRSVATVRRPARFWPAAAVASWAASAALGGLLLTRPARVVTEIQIVERLVERPEEVSPAVETPAPPRQPDRAVATDERRTGPRPRPPAAASAFSAAPDGSLSDYRRRLHEGRDLFAAVGPPAASSTPSSPPPTYGDLRREWLATGTLGDGLF